MEHKAKDDFEWEQYTNKYYLNEIDEVMAKGEMFKFKNTYIKDREIIEKDGVHFNSVNICKDILKFKSKIKKVFECGCSCGYHLYNIKFLFPDIEIAGCDLLKSQVEIAGKKLNMSRDILDKILIMDFTENISEIGVYDYVFTNAVIMHLAYEKAIKFINNMVKLNPNYIRMNENGVSHNWDMLFKECNLTNYNKGSGFLFIKKNIVGGIK